MTEPKVFADSYQLALKIFHFSKSIPKSFRPTLGRRLEEDALAITHDVRTALLTAKSERLGFLKSASQRLDEMRVNLRLCHDLKIMAVGNYKEITESTRELGQELGGLIKSVKNKTGASS